MSDLVREARAETPWLWHGLLAPGNVTVLTSQWKSGKTTLLSVFLVRLQNGGVLAGLPVAPGKAVVVSEEGPALWLARGLKLGLGDHVCWFCQPFADKPSPDQWLGLLDRLAEVHARHGLSLVAIDPLAFFLPGRTENTPEAMLAFLASLRRLTRLGLSVLLLHHPGKRAAAAGLAARGSGALGAHADIVIEMKWYARGSETDRRRRLRAFSRFQETPRELVIELNADGTDYVSHGDFQEEEFGQGWRTLRPVLETAPAKLTRAELADFWPPDAEPPKPVTLWRWLERGVSQGLVAREGSGRKNDPFRYWLPGQEEKWKDMPPWDPVLAKLLEEAEAGDPFRHVAPWPRPWDVPDPAGDGITR